jgi:hypothetical protein
MRSLSTGSVTFVNPLYFAAGTKTEQQPLGTDGTDLTDRTDLETGKISRDFARF